MKYRLFHKDLEIGIIEHLEENFPNLFGEIKLFPGIENKNKLMQQYIQYSVKGNILMEEDENKWLEYIEKEEFKFIELIESNDWKLIDEKGETHDILTPIFCDKNEIVWRWNF